jgi:hypothetical protein
MTTLTRNEVLDALIRAPEDDPNPIAVVEGLAKERGMSLSSSDAAELANKLAPETSSGLKSFAAAFGRLPGDIVSGIGRSIVGVSELAALPEVAKAKQVVEAGSQEAPFTPNEMAARNDLTAYAAGAETMHQELNRVREDLTPDWAKYRPTSMLGKLGAGLTEFVGENLPEVGLSAATGGFGAAKLLAPTAKKIGEWGLQSGRKKLVAELLNKSIYNSVENAATGVLAAAKSQGASDKISEMLEKTAAGDEAGANWALDEAIGHMAQEAVVNAGMGFIAVPALKALGTPLKWAWAKAKTLSGTDAGPYPGSLRKKAVDIAAKQKAISEMAETPEKAILVSDLEGEAVKLYEEKLDYLTSQTDEILKAHDGYSYSPSAGDNLKWIMNEMNDSIAKVESAWKGLGKMDDANIMKLDAAAESLGKMRALYRDQGYDRWQTIKDFPEQATANERLQLKLMEAVEKGKWQNVPDSWSNDGVTKGLIAHELSDEAANASHGWDLEARGEAITKAAEDSGLSLRDYTLAALKDGKLPLSRGTLIGKFLEDADSSTLSDLMAGDQKVFREMLSEWAASTDVKNLTYGMKPKLNHQLLNLSGTKIHTPGVTLPLAGIDSLKAQLKWPTEIREIYHKKVLIGIDKAIAVLKNHIATDNLDAYGKANARYMIDRYKDLKFQVEVARSLPDPGPIAVAQWNTGKFNGVYTDETGVINNNFWTATGKSEAFHEVAHHLAMRLDPEVKKIFSQFVKEIQTKTDPESVALWESIRPGWGDARWEQAPDEVFAQLIARFMAQDTLRSNSLGLPSEIIKWIQSRTDVAVQRLDRAPSTPETALAKEVLGYVSKKAELELWRANPEVQGRILAHKEYLGKLNEGIRKLVDDDIEKAIVDDLNQKIASTGATTRMSALAPIAKDVKVVKPVRADVKAKALGVADDLAYELEQFASKLAPESVTSSYWRRVLGSNSRLIDKLLTEHKAQVLHNGILSFKQMVKEIKTNPEAQKLLQRLEEKLALVEQVNRGLYNYNPRAYLNDDPKLFENKFYGLVEDLKGKIPWLKDRLAGHEKFQNNDISKWWKFWNSGQWMVKKYPMLQPVYSAWRDFLNNSREFTTKVVQGKMDPESFRLPTGASPLEEYLALPKGSKILDEVNAALKFGDELASMRLGAKKLREKGFLMDDNSILSRATLEAKIGEISDEAYSIYQGTRYTLHWLGQDMMDYLKLKNLATDNRITKMRNDLGLIDGYIPHRRSGKWEMAVVDPKNPSGDLLFYVLGDSRQALLKQAEKIKAEGIADAGVGPGALDDSHFRFRLHKEVPSDQFFGASPEHIGGIIERAKQLYEKTTGDELDSQLSSAFDTAIIESMKSGFVMSHTLKRKNIGGWDTENLQRAILDYVRGYGAAKSRYSAMRQSIGAMKFLSGKQYSEAYQWADQLTRDMAAGSNDLGKGFAATRNLVMWKYLGFNISSALIQLTQNPIMAMPRMELDGIKRSGRQLFRAMREVVKAKKSGLGDEWYKSKNFNKWDQRALYEGFAQGTTWSNFVEGIMSRLDADNHLRIGSTGRLMEASMWMMRQVEELNRSATLLASYRNIRHQLLAKATKQTPEILERIHREAMDRATSIVNDSHLIYDRANLPQSIRGKGAAATLGRMAYMLKTFSHGYIQYLGWLGRSGGPGAQAALKSMATLALLGGATAVPGYEVLDKWLQTTSGKYADQKLEEMMGDHVGAFVANGLSSFLPTNLGKRLNPGFGDVGGLLTPPAYSWFQGWGKSRDAFMANDWVRAFRELPVIPNQAARFVDAASRATEGYRTSTGKLIKGTNLTPAETVASILGFTPSNREYARYLRYRLGERYIQEKRRVFYNKIRNKAANKSGFTADDQNELQQLRAEARKFGHPIGQASLYRIAATGMFDTPDE